ncbi:MAG: radical SAM protein [Veillonella caviae]|nr:radical SAM protein [Veillonella caviae]MDY5482562.1 radical SAM protein [Veillonella caviae]
MDILKENNIFTLTFTGGEIFTKKDFLKIYEYAYDNLFKIKLLTNLSLLNDEIINFLIKKPPILISTSLYGFSEKTYFDFTKKANMFNTIIQNIEKLQQSNIKIKVKVIANTIIKNELLKMESYFNKNKIDRFFYFKIHNFTDGDSSAKKIQLDDSFIELFKQTINFYKDFEKFYKINQKNSYETCNAGNTFFSIDPIGNVFLCEQEPTSVGNILADGFDMCWKNLFNARKKYIEVDLGCNSCNYKKICTYCAPKLKSEYGIPYKNTLACLEIKKLYQRMYQINDNKY